MKVPIRDRVAGIAYPVTRGPVGILFGLLLRAAEKQELQGFELRLHRLRSPTGDLLQKLERALELMQIHDPRRFKHFRKHIRIIGIGHGTKSQYLPTLGAVVLREGFVVELEADTLASVLVHEGCHARIESLGVKYTPCAKQRIERLCLRNQLWFLQRVPGSESLAEIYREDFDRFAQASA